MGSRTVSLSKRDGAWLSARRRLVSVGPGGVRGPGQHTATFQAVVE